MHGLSGCPEVTNTLGKPRRWTRAGLLAGSQTNPKRGCAGRGLICREKIGRKDGGSAFRHVPQGAGGWRTALDLPAHPSDAAAQLHPARRKENWTVIPSARRHMPGTPGCWKQGRPGQLKTGMGGQAGPWCSRRNLQDALVGTLGILWGDGPNSPSESGQYSVHVGSCWPHGCLVAMVLFCSTYRSCSHCAVLCGLSSAKEDDGSTWEEFVTLELRRISEHHCVWSQGKVLHNQRSPEASAVLGRSNRCHHHSLPPGSSHRWVRVASEGTKLQADSPTQRQWSLVTDQVQCM